MSKVALVTGADRGLGLGLTEELLKRGWMVLAGQHLNWPDLGNLKESYPENLVLLPLDVSSDSSVVSASEIATSHVQGIDLLVCNAAINRSAHISSIREEQNFDDMQSEFNINALGALRVTKAFLALLEKGEMKRLCYVSSEAGSIAASERKGWFGYCMSKAALNMAVKNLHNDLSPDGFSFRLYHPGWMRTYMRGTKNQEARYEPEESAGFALDCFLSEVPAGDLNMVDWEGKRWPW